jgi:hypothetical protein
MIVYELLDTEDHPVYQDLQIANLGRQYDFLRSIIATSLALGRPFLSTHVIKALNFHAITCLHTNPGEFRPCPVYFKDSDHKPPDHYRVQALMDDLVNQVNRMWEQSDPLALAAFILWRLNHIHPFINGNGRTARAICYFVLCLKLGGWLAGTTILPELIRRDRKEYVDALRHADKSLPNLDLAPLQQLLERLLKEQISSAQPPLNVPPADGAAAADVEQPASPPPGPRPPD